MKTHKHHGIECPYCLEQLYSMHVHDFRYCQCGYCFIDGGRSYQRWGYGCNEDGVYDKYPRPISQDWLLLEVLWRADTR